MLVPTATGAQVPLDQLSEVRYARGPQVIKTEDTFLTSYVIFDKRPGFAEVSGTVAGNVGGGVRCAQQIDAAAR